MGRHETPLQTMILKWLTFKGIWHIRLNVGGMGYTKKSGKRGFVKFGVAGLPDIMATEPGTGRVVWIEVKSDRGVMSDEQIRFMETALEKNHHYILAHGRGGLDDVIKFFDEREARRTT